MLIQLFYCDTQAQGDTPSWEVTQEDSQKQQAPVCLSQIYKQPTLLSATTGNHILGAELRKSPRMSLEVSMSGPESITCEEGMKEPDQDL